jgi:hypothetical protein
MEDEMGRARNMNGEEECIYVIDGNDRRKENQEDQSVGGLIILRSILEGEREREREREKGCGGTRWIDVAQDRDQYRGLVNTEMTLRFT